MADFIEILSPSALKDIKTANDEVVKLVANIDKAGESMRNIKTPSGSDNAIKNLNDSLAKHSAAIENVSDKTLEAIALEKEEIRLKNEIAKVNAKIKLSNDQNTITLNTQKTVLKALNGAYAELSEKVKRASDNLQNIIARGRLAGQSQLQYNREIDNASKSFRTLQERVLMADKAVDKWNRTGERSLGFARNLMSAFGFVGGVTLFAQITKDIFETTKEIQSLDKALSLVTGTLENFKEQQLFLSRIAENYGIEINGLTKQFTQFYVGAKDKLSGNQIQKIFESITKASSAMGLSTQQQERAFLALNQMMSKGTVQAEELRGQLGEALPGAFGIMAKAMGVSEKQLGKMMKDGDVLASDVLPRFAEQLEKTYNIANTDRIDTMVSAQNRLANSWTNLIRTMNEGDGLIPKMITKTLNHWAYIVNKTAYYLETAEERRKRQLTEISAQSRSTAEDFVQKFKTLEEKEKYVNKASLGLEKLNKDARQKQKELIDENRKIFKKGFANDLYSAEQEAPYKKYKQNLKDITKINTNVARRIGLIKGLRESLIKNNSAEENDNKVKREKIHLSFAEVESLYALKLAELELQKIRIANRVNDEKAQLDDRLKARKEFSEKSIEILNLETDKEKAILLEKYNDDLAKNNLADKNKDITAQESTKNLADINNRFNNEMAKSDVVYSQKWEALMKEDADFYRKIEEQKAGYVKLTLDRIFKYQQEQQKKTSENERLILSKREEAYQKYIQLQKDENDIAKQRELNQAVDVLQVQDIIDKYDKLNKSLDELIKKDSPFAKSKKDLELYINNLGSGQLEKILNDIGISSAKTFLDFDQNLQSPYMKMISLTKQLHEENKKVMDDETKSLEERQAATEAYNQASRESFAYTFQAIGDIAQEVSQKIFDLSNQRFEREQTNLQKEYEINKAFAGDSASARSEVEAQYQAKQRELKKREFKAHKQQALFNIAIDTAQGVVSALASTPPNLPLSIAIGALGALQAGLVASQQIPSYWKGTENHQGGLMMVNDAKGSNYKEIIQTPDGKMRMFNERNKVLSAPKGTKVIDGDKTMDMLMFNSGLNNILTNNGIMMPKVEVNAPSIDFSPVIDAIKEIPESGLMFDNGKFQQYVKNGNQMKINENARKNFSGKIIA